MPTSRLLNFIDRKRNIVNKLPSKIIDSSINKTICINTTKNLLRPIIYSYLLEDCGGFRGFTSLFRGQMLRGRILPFLFNPKSRKENVGRLGGGVNIERKREKERGGGRGSEGCQSEKGELFRRAVDTIRDSLHGHCTPFRGAQWLEKVYPDIPPPLSRL